MYTQEHQALQGMMDHFVDAVFRSVVKHCAGVMRHVPATELDALEEEDVALLLEQYVLSDVMGLGLRFMCWKGVVDTTHQTIAGILNKQREHMNGE